MSSTLNSMAGTTSSTDDMRSDDTGSSVVTIQCVRCWDEYQIDAETEWYDCDLNHRHYSLSASIPDRLLLTIWLERHEGPVSIRHREDAAPLSLWQSLC